MCRNLGAKATFYRSAWGDVVLSWQGSNVGVNDANDSIDNFNSARTTLLSSGGTEVIVSAGHAEYVQEVLQ